MQILPQPGDPEPVHRVRRLRARLPGTPQGELLGGAVTAFCLPVGTFLVTSLVCLAAAKLSPWLGLAVQMFWCGQAPARRWSATAQP